MSRQQKNPPQHSNPTTQSRKPDGLRAADPCLEREQACYANPIPSREYILQFLEERGTPIFPNELSEQFAITEEEEYAFTRRISAMERDGQLIVNRKGALCLSTKLDLLSGRVQGHPDGYGFLVLEEGGTDLYLSAKEMNKVLHGDRALVRLVGVDRRGRREGRIVEVIERVNKYLVGRLYIERGVPFVVAEDRRISQDILIEHEGLLNAQSGQVVVVELFIQPSHHTQPVGRVLEILGDYADPGMEIEIALRKHKLPHLFGIDAQNQAAMVSQTVTPKDWEPVLGVVPRVDLRDLPLVTIDGETARDFDDAVYAEKQGKGWRLMVAIADVSHYVLPGDALDGAALERGNSVYFPRRVIPMLPEALSNGICSLNPNVERLCMVCDMQVSSEGDIQDYRFYPAVIESKARLSYTQVWDMLACPQGETSKQYTSIFPNIQTLYAVFQAFHKARIARGAINFETMETEMRFDENGKIIEIVPVFRNDAHRLIEECMLAANVCAADILARAAHPGLYRVHGGPTPEKLENLRIYLRSLALTLPGGDDPQAGDYMRLLEQIQSRPDASLLQTMLLRSLQQAIYSPENTGHFGLGYEAYTHFTSPIRRYPDLLIHRVIKAILANKQYKPASGWNTLGLQCSTAERRADEASRDVENWLKCYFMQDKLSQEFEGTISAVTDFGIFVLLDRVYVEGLVHISELGTDYFHFDEIRRELKGERTGKIYRMTDRLKVQVARVDMESSRIDFVLSMSNLSTKTSPRPGTSPMKKNNNRIGLSRKNKLTSPTHKREDTQ